MRVSRTCWLVGCLSGLMLALIGCEGPDEPPPDPVTPCETGWGAIPETGQVVHVVAGAEAGGDGSVAAPLTTIDEGLAAARAGDGPWTVGVGPGTYDGSFALGGSSHPDTGLAVVGCGPDQTVVRAVDYEDIRQPTFSIQGPAEGISIAGMTLSGGRKSVFVWGGAGLDQPIRLEDLVLEDSIRVGILVDDDGVVDISDVEVDGVETENGRGWGIAIQSGGGFGDAAPSCSVTSSTVNDAADVGIFVHGRRVDLLDTMVLQTRPVGGFFGRGVHYQSGAGGVLDRVTAEGNSDAGLYFHKPDDVLLRDSFVNSTLAAPLSDHDGVTSGDGLAASQNSFAGDVDAYLIRVEGTTFQDNGRSGALLEDVTFGVGENNLFAGNGIFDKGTTFPVADTFLFQYDTVVTGFGEGDAPELDGFGLSPADGFDTLEMAREPLEPDGG